MAGGNQHQYLIWRWLAQDPQPQLQDILITLPVKIGSQMYQVSFLVVHNLGPSLILGMDFMVAQVATLDLNRGCLYIGRQLRETIHWTTTTSQPIGSGALPDLSPKHPPELRQLLEEFRDLFEVGFSQSTTRSTRHRIQLTSDKVVNKRCYPMTPAKKQVLYAQVDKMLKAGVIDPSNSLHES